MAGVRAVRRERDRYARHPVRHVLARGLWRLLGLAALAAVAAALAPVTLAATAAAAAGWWRGWPPRRLYATAAWCLPMTAAWLAAVAAWPARAAGPPPPRRRGLAGPRRGVRRRRGRCPGGRYRRDGSPCRRGGRCRRDRDRLLRAALPGVALPAGVGPGPLWLRVAAAPYRAWLAIVAARRARAPGRRRGRRRAARRPARRPGGRAGVAVPAVPDADRRGRPHSGGARHVRQQAVAPPGAHRQGAAGCPRCAAIDFP